MDPSDFQILYEEGPCLVVNKPGGLLTQAPPEIDSLEVRIKRFLKRGKTNPARSTWACRTGSTGPSRVSWSLPRT